MVKDKELKRVRKHLPAVARETKSGVAKAVAVVKDHKGAAIGIGVGAAVLAAGVGVVTYFTQKDKRKAEKRFSKSLHVYLQAAQEGKITVEIVESLITDLEVVLQFNENKEMPLKLTAKELTTLFYSIYDFTKRLAEANHILVDDLKVPKRFKKNTVVDLSCIICYTIISLIINEFGELFFMSMRNSWRGCKTTVKDVCTAIYINAI